MKLDWPAVPILLTSTLLMGGLAGEVDWCCDISIVFMRYASNLCLYQQLDFTILFWKYLSEFEESVKA